MGASSFSDKLIQAQQAEEKLSKINLDKENNRLESLRLSAEKKRKQNDLIDKKIEREDKNIKLLNDKLELSKRALEEKSEERKTKAELIRARINQTADNINRRLDSQELTSMAKDYAKIEVAKIKSQDVQDTISARRNNLILSGELENKKAENSLKLEKARFDKEKQRNDSYREWLDLKRDQLEYQRDRDQRELDYKIQRDNKREREKRDKELKKVERLAAKQQAKMEEKSEPKQVWLEDDLGVPLKPDDLRGNPRRTAEYIAFRILAIHLPKGDIYTYGFNDELYWRQPYGYSMEIGYKASELERAAQTVLTLSRAQASEVTRIVSAYAPNLNPYVIRVSNGLFWDMEEAKLKKINETEDFDLLYLFPWIRSNIEEYSEERENAKNC